MTSPLDKLETRAPQEREQALLSALPAQIAHAQQRSAAFADILKHVDASAIQPPHWASSHTHAAW